MLDTRQGIDELSIGNAVFSVSEQVMRQHKVPLLRNDFPKPQTAMLLMIFIALSHASAHQFPILRTSARAVESSFAEQATFALPCKSW